MIRDPADESRAASRRRSERRRILSRIETLLLVVGILCLVIAGVIALLSMLHNNHVRAKLLTMSVWYVSAGLVLTLVYVAIFFIPEWRQRRRTHRRRRGDYGTAAVAQPAVANADSSPGGSRSGMVLIYVLVLVGLIAALALQVQVTARAALKRGHDVAQRAEVQRAAEDAARHALRTLADDEDLRMDTTNDAWAAGETNTTPTGILTTVKVIDENRYFDLNNITARPTVGSKAPDEILGDIFVECGQFAASDLIDALTDWTDGDDDGIHESSLYLKRVPPYDAANRILYTRADLLAIDGLTRDMFRPPVRMSSLEAFKADLNTCVTVLPVSRQQPIAVNLNTATRGALIGLFGITEERLVETIIVMRGVRPLTSPDVLGPMTSPAILESVRPYLDVKSSYFSIDALAESVDHSARIRVLARRNQSGNVDVLQWM